MNIVFLDTSTMGNPPNMGILNKLGSYTSYELTAPNETFSRLQDVEIAITCKVIIDKQLIQQLPKLKLICIAATGINNIDLDYARHVGIAVKNVAGYSTNSVAQATFAMLLQLLNQCSYYDNYVKNGSYCNNNMFTHYGPKVYELAGKQFGIIGLGNIGKKVAAIAEGFGCRIRYYSTSGSNQNNQYKQLSLNELLINSDIVSIHCQLNEKTKNLITASQFKLMKPSAILINMARGGIVDELDLANAINNDLIAGACFDVFTKEPILAENPLLQIKDKQKIVLAPHTAWISVEARTLLIEKIAGNIREYQENQ